MKTSNSWVRVRGIRQRESGQVMVFVLLGLGTFLIGATAFAIDLSNLWFHRQSAQSAADAACTAGAMDLLSNKTNNTTTAGNFQQGVNFDCNATTPNNNNSNPAPCVFAALNGYPSSLLQATAAAGNLGDNVSVIFNGAPAPGVAAANIMEVDVTDNLPTFLAGMLMGKGSQSVRAVAKCGIDQVAAPIPLLVLDPLNPDNKTSAFDVQGTPDVTIYGGPQQSIQVNSKNSAAVNIGGSALVDLSQGGPAIPPTGSDFGVQGGPTAPPACSGGKGFCYGTTGQWVSPHSQIQDPLQNVPSPTTAYNGVTLTTYTATNSSGGFDTTSLPAGLSLVGNGVGGCSINNAGGQCVVFQPGKYPTGICLGNSCGGGGNNAHAGVFVEGLYYIGGTGLTINSNSCARMSTAAGPGSFSGWGGAIFYFSGTATVNVAANAGDPTSNNSCDSTVPYNTGTGAPTGSGVSCDANAKTHAPSNLPATLTGNVLLAPCKGTWGDQYLAAGLTVPSNPGTQRGILFFQDRSAQAVTANISGGGSYAMAGTYYFHSCSSTSIDGTNGLNCAQPTGSYSSGQYYTNTLNLSGNSGASSYVLGEIIVDNLELGGGGSIYMDLDPSSALNVYKAALYQ
jgi:Putative Flp pilus-assembly TadE/G-like